MEIKFEKFNALNPAYLRLTEFVTHQTTRLVWSDDKEVAIPDLTDEAKERMYAIADQIREIFPERLTDFDIPDEIDRNIVQIQDPSQVQRYLKYIKGQIESLMSIMKDWLGYNDLVENDWGKIIRDADQSELTTSGPLRFINPIKNVRVALLRAISQVQEILDCIEAHLPEDHDSSSALIAADRHRLLLLQQLGIFDILHEKYMDPKQPLLNLNDFSKLIAGIISPQSKDIRSEVGKLISENADPKKKRLVQTDGAIKTVNSFLASIGLPLTDNNRI